MARDIRTGVADANGLKLAYEDLGSPGDPAVLLIMGFSAQLTQWPLAFCDRIVAQGYRVIRFDNRDIGLSTKLSGTRVDGSRALRVVNFALGRPSAVPYTLFDMAQDTVELLDYLGLSKVHVIGASMGGMIAQILAAQHPQRVSSLGILFSSTNQPFLPPGDPRILRYMLGGPGKDATREHRIEFSVQLCRMLNGKKHAMTDDELHTIVAADFDRDYSPAGIVRQLNATLGTGSLLEYTKRITAPTVVVHGTDDGLLRAAGGKAVARAIGKSSLHLVAGMGHSIPDSVIPEVADLFLANIRRNS
jgi:pimeloyl-ACP methyl ester carboxylesterase